METSKTTMSGKILEELTGHPWWNIIQKWILRWFNIKICIWINTEWKKPNIHNMKESHERKHTNGNDWKDTEVLKCLFPNTEKTVLFLFLMFFVYSIFNNKHLSYFL